MLRKDLPKSVRRILNRQGVADIDILLSTDSEIDDLGRYTRHWFVMTDEKLMAFAQHNGHSRVLKAFPIDKVEEVRLDSRVGSGFLEVKVDGNFEEMVRFLNTDAQKFAKIAQKINGVKKGTPVRISEEDAKDDRRCIRCGRMLQGTKDLCPRCISKGRTLKRLVGMARPHALAISVLLLLILATSLIALITPRLGGLFVAAVTGEEVRNIPILEPVIAYATTTLGWSDGATRIGMIVAALGLIGLVLSVIGGVTGLLSGWVGTRLTYDLRKQMYEQLQRQNVSYYDQNHAGQLMSRITQDTASLQGFITTFATSFLSQIVRLVGISVVIFSLNPKLALYTLLPAPIVIASTYMYCRLVMPHIRRSYDRRSKLSNILYGCLSGIRVVKAFGQEDREAANFDEHSQRLRKAGMTMAKANSLYNPSIGYIFTVGGFFVRYVGGVAVLGDTMSTADLFTFLGYIGMFYGPMQALSRFNQSMTSYVTAAYRVFEILDSEPEVKESKETVELAEVQGEIEFDHVTFGYDPLNPVLKDISFKIKPGEMIGIVGRSGSGKTTMVNLICRFYDPQQGTIKIDEQNLRNLKKRDLHRAVGLVLQEPYLFRGTIAENIAYGRPEAGMEEVMEAANAAYIHHKIMRFRDGYDTRLGDSGSGLSGGERQRVSIARALLYNPQILILDEATSSVDTESEREIQKALESLASGRTTIAIAHRLSTLRNADRIIVMDEGHIAEMGSHNELMEKQGLYYKLVKIQTQLSEDKQSVDRLQSEADEEEREAKEQKERKKARAKAAAPAS